VRVTLSGALRRWAPLFGEEESSSVWAAALGAPRRRNRRVRREIVLVQRARVLIPSPLISEKSLISEKLQKVKESRRDRERFGFLWPNWMGTVKVRGTV
jgi:hypothetical protein